MNRERRVTYRYFLFSFSIAFLALSLMFLALMVLVHPKTPRSLRVQDDITDVKSAYLPKAEDALTVLFMASPDKETPPHTYLLIRFDPARGSVPIVVLPAQTVADNNGKRESLTEIYQYGGMEYTKEALAGTLGIPIDRYVRMNGSAFETAAAAIGNIEFDLPYDATLEQAETTVTLYKGRHLLDSKKTAGLMTWEGHQEGWEAQSLLIGQLTAAIVNQRMDVVLSTVVDRVFETIINLIDTDISYTDYFDRKEAAEFLAELGRDPAVNITPTGTWSDDGELYHLSDTFLALLAQTYG